jgi:hypothetical protein
MALNDLDNVKLTFGSIGKITALVAIVVTCCAFLFQLQGRQQSFENSQREFNQMIVSQIDEIKLDARGARELLTDMRMTLARTNTILEQMNQHNQGK